jgi:F/Y-rich N-terminus/F/Y rich C-terminus
MSRPALPTLKKRVRKKKTQRTKTAVQVVEETEQPTRRQSFGTERKHETEIAEIKVEKAEEEESRRQTIGTPSELAVEPADDRDKLLALLSFAKLDPVEKDGKDDNDENMEEQDDNDSEFLQGDVDGDCVDDDDDDEDYEEEMKRTQRRARRASAATRKRSRSKSSVSGSAKRVRKADTAADKPNEVDDSGAVVTGAAAAVAGGRSRRYMQVPMDKHGRPVMPLSFRGATIYSMGRIAIDRPAYHSKRYIWPAGFKSTRSYWSMQDCSRRTVYTSEILDAGDQPLFLLVSHEQPDKPIIRDTPSGAWAEVGKRVGAMRSERSGRVVNTQLSGPEMFGFGLPTVAKLIQEMPGAEACHRYQRQDFRPSSAKRTVYDMVEPLDTSRYADQVCQVAAQLALNSLPSSRSRASSSRAKQESAAAADTSSSSKDSLPSVDTTAKLSASIIAMMDDDRFDGDRLPADNVCSALTAGSSSSSSLSPLSMPSVRIDDNHIVHLLSYSCTPLSSSSLSPSSSSSVADNDLLI